MRIHFLIAVLVVDRGKDESSSFVIPDDVANSLPFSGLKSFVGKVLETKSGCVVGGGLFGIADPECDMT